MTVVARRAVPVAVAAVLAARRLILARAAVSALQRTEAEAQAAKWRSARLAWAAAEVCIQELDTEAGLRFEVFPRRAAAF